MRKSVLRPFNSVVRNNTNHSQIGTCCVRAVRMLNDTMCDYHVDSPIQRSVESTRSDACQNALGKAATTASTSGGTPEGKQMYKVKSIGNGKQKELKQYTFTAIHQCIPRRLTARFKQCRLTQTLGDAFSNQLGRKMAGNRPRFRVQSWSSLDYFTVAECCLC